MDKESNQSRERATQQRAVDTRNSILNEAKYLFTQKGYEGVSVRALENKARVQRGAVAYHFGNKQELWKAVVQNILRRLDHHLVPLQPLLQDLDEDTRLQATITAFVRFTAETPELNRIITQEGRQASWRLTFLVENVLQNRLGWLKESTGILNDPHTYYLAIGAATLVFDVEYECRELFGIDPSDEDFVREHARRLSQIIVLLRKLEHEANAA
jgi:AcrR family transcriptional regulator